MKILKIQMTQRNIGEQNLTSDFMWGGAFGARTGRRASKEAWLAVAPRVSGNLSRPRYPLP